jgi:hypothetical protein
MSWVLLFAARAEFMYVTVLILGVQGNYIDGQDPSLPSRYALTRHWWRIRSTTIIGERACR